MTQPAYAVVPASFPTPKLCSFTATNTTVAKVVMEPNPANLAATIPLTGGNTVLSLTASSTDAAAKELILWLGKILTTQGAGATGALSTTTSTIVRASGSFITDGWLPGDAVMLFTPPGTAQAAAGIDGIVGVITTVAALTLTLNGTPLAANAGLTSGTRVVNVSQLFRKSIPANSGNVAGTPNVSLINATEDANTVSEWKLGPDTMLIAALAATASALPAQINVSSRCVANY